MSFLGHPSGCGEQPDLADQKAHTNKREGVVQRSPSSATDNVMTQADCLSSHTIWSSSATCQSCPHPWMCRKGGFTIQWAVAQTAIPLTGSLRRFLSTNLGDAEDQGCQLLEPEGRVLTSPGASLRFVKKRLRTREKGFGQQPVKM